MAGGNEGDAIILFAFRQIECAIPETVNAIGQILPDVLVEIIARSLLLISNGEVKFAPVLPANIASRHRICTNMANKIKELGFTGECGYNQLLYPTESQTKTLLTWLVQKLPRSEEEQVEEVLGANVILNRKIISTLTQWKKSPWLLPGCCKGLPSRNIYTTKTLVTLESTHLDPICTKKIKSIFAECHARKIAAESTLLERHAFDVIRDSAFNISLDTADGGNGDAMNGTSEFHHAFLNGDMKALVKAAVANSVNQAATSSAQHAKRSGNDGSHGNTQISSLTEDLQSDLLGKSLTDVIQRLDREANGEDSTGNGNSTGIIEDKDRGSRFSHATVFSKETNDHLLSMTSDKPLDVNYGGAAGGSADGVADGTEEGVVTIDGVTVDTSGMTAQEKTKAVSEVKQRAKKVKEEADERKREAELDVIRAAIAEANAILDGRQRNMENIQSKIRLLESEHAAAVLQSEQLEKEIVVKRKTLEMLPSAGENISKLQQICAGSAKKLMTLGQEWEQHRVPLIEKYRTKRNVKLNRKAKCKQMIDDMRKYKEEMQNMLQDLKNKQEKSRLLEEELKKLPKNINRNLYTVRILDIIKSISKQDKDITKVTSDIREIQKTINVFTNTVQRADAVAEDKVYSAANSVNRDTAMVDSYRHLTALRNRFESLIAVVNKIGQMEKQSRDFETKIDQEVSRVSGNNFERIRNDLEEIKKENNVLVSQIKALQKK